MNNEEMFNDFDKRLKLALKSAGYTQVRVAQEIRVSKGAMLNYVKGRIPEAEILYKISKLLGVSIEWLLTGKESREVLTNEEEMLIDYYRKLNEIQKIRVLGYLEGIIEASK